jgi:glycosyltransferase involved in cell wall biosynthesis
MRREAAPGAVIDRHDARVPSSAPHLSVVVATHNRPDRLARLVASLAAQEVPEGTFETVVVDDGSSDPAVADVLDAASRSGVRVVRRTASAGPATARNAGVAVATAPLVAFTDDDCEAPPDWVAQVLRSAAAHPGVIIQGRTTPIPDELAQRTPFSRTQMIVAEDPAYQTCNMVYPRAVLDTLGGFDEVFPLPAGEDTDLAWRARERGFSVVFDEAVHTHHAVLHDGLGGMLRYARRWGEIVPIYKRFPELRREGLHRGVFFSPVHEHLLRFVLALLVQRRSRVLALWLAWPYLRRLGWRRSGPLLAPVLLAHDAVELAGVVRGAVRGRVLVL